MKKKVFNHITTIIFIIMCIILSISFAILIPIIFRPFYYVAIKLLNIEKQSGYTYSEIKEAFDGVMDFIWKGEPFYTGVLAHSEEGAAHFKDCIPLFWLDLWCFIISFIYVLTHFLLVKFKVLEFVKYKGFHPLFYAGVTTILFVIIIGIFGLIDFYKLFEAFHKLFFPGKDNWEFDEDADEIIKILPENFFALCAAWIGSHILIFDITAIVYGIKTRKNGLGKINNETIENIEKIDEKE
ncbi:MAG: TIGR01906 family membrane protein [Acholeplasmatales bacterium]|nr:TIGR01906 family membrane protein [Acholeplasmatales bacterium]